MYSIQNNNTTDHCHRSLSTSSSSPRLSSDVQAAKKAAATHVRYWELFPASYWVLSIFFYLLHVKATTRSRGINGAHVSPKVGHHHLYPNCCLQILQEIHKKCKACLESKEHLQLEEYFLACGINKCCTVLKVREGWMCDIRVWRVKCEVTWVRDPTMYITRSKFMLMIFKYFHE